MDKKLKKIIAFCLSNITLLATCLPVYAESINTEPNDTKSSLYEIIEYKDDYDDYDIFTIAVDKYCKDSNENRIIKDSYDTAIDFLYEIPFEKYDLTGCRELYIDQLHEWKDEGYILTGEYSVILPSLQSTNSYTDMVYETSYNTAYRTYTKTNNRYSTLCDWAAGIINFGMNFVNYRLITIPYSIMTSIPSSYTTYNGDIVEFVSREAVTTRTTAIRDTLCHYSGDPTEFVPQTCEQCVNSDLVATYIPNRPSVGPFYKNLDQIILKTTNYDNPVAIKQEAYNNYMTYGGVIWHTIPQAILITRAG